MRRRYAWIGTGAMGRPMASRLLGAGLPLVVHDRVPAAAGPLLAAGAGWAEDPASAARDADVVLTCLPDNEATEAVLLGPGGVRSQGGVRCVVDLSTSGSEMAVRLGAALAASGIGFVDAPVTGGPARARDGTLTVIAAGQPEAIAQARPALEAIGSKVLVLGERPGQGQAGKVINNMLNYLALAGTCEAMVLAVKAGLDPRLVLEVLNNGTGRNSATEAKFPRAILPRSFDYGATVRTADKDLQLFLRAAEAEGVRTPIASQLAGLWASWAEEHASEDLTTIVRLFEGWSGVEVAAPR